MAANDRVKSEARAIVRVSNDNLVCKDCLMRYEDSVILGNTSRCEAYPACKPNQILLGGKCDQYIKQ